MKTSLFFSLSFIVTISSPVMCVISADEPDNTHFIEAHVASKKEDKSDCDPKSKNERLTALSKGLGYAGLSFGCAACIFFMFNIAYEEFCDDRVERSRQNLVHAGIVSGSERYRKSMAKALLNNVYYKTFYLVAPVCASAAVGAAMHKYRLLSNAWKHIKTVLN